VNNLFESLSGGRGAFCAGRGVEVSEFISDEDGGNLLPRQGKRRKASFCEIIKGLKIKTD